MPSASPSWPPANPCAWTGIGGRGLLGHVFEEIIRTVLKTTEILINLATDNSR